ALFPEMKAADDVKSSLLARWGFTAHPFDSCREQLTSLFIVIVIVSAAPVLALANVKFKMTGKPRQR
ncbi:MAG: hypothetical protein LH481_06185, partial [Burkholderiales bacterium]|nr:hypothetical protein [Burkholderiales bacterium]